MRIHTIHIGSTVPGIIVDVVNRNIDFCRNNSMEYIIHHFERDKRYKCCGIQAEMEKLRLMATCQGDIVADWDVVFYGVPVFFTSDKIFFGYRGKAGPPDTFVSYHNSPGLSFLLSEKLKVASIQYSDRPAFTSILACALFNGEMVERFPDDTFLHLGTGLSMSNVVDTFAEINKARWTKIEEKAYQHWKAFDQNRLPKHKAKGK